MVKIRDREDIEEHEWCFLYSPEGKEIGLINSLAQFNDVRLQIQEEDVDGYYVIWTDSADSKQYRIDINRYGAAYSWPEGFFTQVTLQSQEILKRAMKKRKGER